MRATILGYSLTLILLVCDCVKDTADTVDNWGPNEVNKSRDVFVPTKEWQEIIEGQSIPAGLHVRIDMQTGLKEAKLMEKDDSDTEYDHITRNGMVTDAVKQAFGESDRRGVVNKRTKVFRAEEVKEMLRNLNSDGFSDQENVPRIADSRSPSCKGKSKVEHAEEKEENLKVSDHLMKSMKDLKLSFHRDIEMMIEISKVLADNSSGVSELCHALEELEYYVHQIDNARDLNVIGGLVLVVRLLNHTHPEVRSWAAHVIGSASQSNPTVQAQALEYNSLPLLSTLLSSSEPDLVQRRALFALSALLRGNSQEQLNFIEVYHGLSVLGSQFEERGPKVQLKAIVFLTDLLNDEFSEGETNGHHLKMPVVIYSEVLNSGWCKNIPLLIYSDQLVRVEKGLIAMEPLVQTCGFTTEMPRLKDLMKWLENITDEDMEYVNQLLEQCKTLLKSIRQYNSDL